jgi:hypothetical protein
MKERNIRTVKTETNVRKGKKKIHGDGRRQRRK